MLRKCPSGALWAGASGRVRTGLSVARPREGDVRSSVPGSKWGAKKISASVARRVGETGKSQAPQSGQRIAGGFALLLGNAFVVALVRPISAQEFPSETRSEAHTSELQSLM